MHGNNIGSSIDSTIIVGRNRRFKKTAHIIIWA